MPTLEELVSHPPQLPVTRALGDIAAAVRPGACAVVTAPPGTGKTTLLPPTVALAEAGTSGRVLVTQPRRVAARARVDGCGRDGVDRVGQALLGWCREHEGGSDTRIAQALSRGVPVKVEQGRVSEHAQLVNGEACRRGGVRPGGVGVSCEESASGASKGLGGERLC